MPKYVKAPFSITFLIARIFIFDASISPVHGQDREINHLSGHSYSDCQLTAAKCVAANINSVEVGISFAIVVPQGQAPGRDLCQSQVTEVENPPGLPPIRPGFPKRLSVVRPAYSTEGTLESTPFRDNMIAVTGGQFCSFLR
jgi:hypothetical protein